MLSRGTRFDKNLMVHRDGSSDRAEKVQSIYKWAVDGDFEVISDIGKYVAQKDTNFLLEVHSHGFST